MQTAPVWSRYQIFHRADFTKDAAVTDSDDFSASQTLPQPLDPDTSEGRVEQQLFERFAKVNSTEEESGISRMLQYWRNRNESFPVTFVGDPTMVDPAQSRSVQGRFSYIPGLTAREFWDPVDFAWWQELKMNYEAIRDEFLSVAANRATLKLTTVLGRRAPSYFNIQSVIGWTPIDLMIDGVWMPTGVSCHGPGGAQCQDTGTGCIFCKFATTRLLPGAAYRFC
jgi:hypothetical protein